MKSPIPPFSKSVDFYKKEYHLGDFDSKKSILVYSSQPDDCKPIISVVIPMYKCDLFEACYKSACYQDFKDEYEIVICDNFASVRPEVLDIIKKYDKGNVRYLVNEENIGLFGNWNRCITSAKADYITFLHADDQLLPDTLSNLWQAHERIGGKTAIIGRYMGVDVNGNILYKETPKRLKGLFKAKYGYYVSHFGLLLNDMCNGCGSLMSKDVLYEIGGYNPNLFPSSDRALIMNYADKYGLYRLNKVIRCETSFISTSNECYKTFAASGYYEEDAIIKRYSPNNLFWKLIRNARYKAVENSTFGFQPEDASNKCPIWARAIDRLVRFVYRNHDIKFF